MKKTDKKIENAIRGALTEVCDIALNEIVGFRWITHFVNYKNFPGSLSIVCVFDTNSDLSDALGAQQDDYLRALIKENLDAVGISIRDPGKQIICDTEEACTNEHDGNWQRRFH